MFWDGKRYTTKKTEPWDRDWRKRLWGPLWRVNSICNLWLNWWFVYTSELASLQFCQMILKPRTRFQAQVKPWAKDFPFVGILAYWVLCDKNFSKSLLPLPHHHFHPPFFCPLLLCPLPSALSCPLCSLCSALLSFALPSFALTPPTIPLSSPPSLTCFFLRLTILCW